MASPVVNGMFVNPIAVMSTLSNLIAKYVNQQHFAIMLIENIIQLKYKFHS